MRPCRCQSRGVAGPDNLDPHPPRGKLAGTFPPFQCFRRVTQKRGDAEEFLKIQPAFLCDSVALREIRIQSTPVNFDG